MNEVNLRAYKPEDLDELATLDAACFEPPFRFSRGAMRRFAEAKNALVRLAYLPPGEGESPQLAGFCIVHLERAGRGRLAGYVVTLDVGTAWRGRGLAQTLMQTMESLAAGKGATEMRLHVSVRNSTAIRLYERLGYLPLRVESGFYGSGGDALVYYLPLPCAPAPATA